jgi:hypothetical protein
MLSRTAFQECPVDMFIHRGVKSYETGMPNALMLKMANVAMSAHVPFAEAIDCEKFIGGKSLSILNLGSKLLMMLHASTDVVAGLFNTESRSAKLARAFPLQFSNGSTPIR